MGCGWLPSKTRQESDVAGTSGSDPCWVSCFVGCGTRLLDSSVLYWTLRVHWSRLDVRRNHRHLRHGNDAFQDALESSECGIVFRDNANDLIPRIEANPSLQAQPGMPIERGSASLCLRCKHRGGRSLECLGFQAEPSLLYTSREQCFPGQRPSGLPSPGQRPCCTTHLVGFAVICFSGFYEPGTQIFWVGLGECGPCAHGSQMFGALNERRPRHTHTLFLFRGRGPRAR